MPSGDGVTVHIKTEVMPSHDGMTVPCLVTGMSQFILSSISEVLKGLLACGWVLGPSHQDRKCACIMHISVG